MTGGRNIQGKWFWVWNDKNLKQPSSNYWGPANIHVRLTCETISRQYNVKLFVHDKRLKMGFALWCLYRMIQWKCIH